MDSRLKGTQVIYHEADNSLRLSVLVLKKKDSRN